MPAKGTRSRKPPQMIGDEQQEAILGESPEVDSAPEVDTAPAKRTRRASAKPKRKRITVDDLIKSDSATVTAGGVALRLLTGAQFGRDVAMTPVEAQEMSYHVNRLWARALLPVIENVMSKVNLSLDENGQDILAVGKVAGAYALRLAEPVILRIFAAVNDLDKQEEPISFDRGRQPRERKDEPREAAPETSAVSEDVTRKANDAALIAWVDNVSFGAAEGE